MPPRKTLRSPVGLKELPLDLRGVVAEYSERYHVPDTYAVLRYLGFRPGTLPAQWRVQTLEAAVRTNDRAVLEWKLEQGTHSRASLGEAARLACTLNHPRALAFLLDRRLATPTSLLLEHALRNNAHACADLLFEHSCKLTCSTATALWLVHRDQVDSVRWISRHSALRAKVNWKSVLFYAALRASTESALDFVWRHATSPAEHKQVTAFAARAWRAHFTNNDDDWPASAGIQADPSVRLTSDSHEQIYNHLCRQSIKVCMERKNRIDVPYQWVASSAVAVSRTRCRS